MRHHHFIHSKSHRNGKILAAILTIAFGVLILIKQLGHYIPEWLLGWETLVIAIGSVILVKHQFRNLFGYVLILIGSVFLFNEIHPDIIETKMIWPILFIFLGLLMLIKTLRFSGMKKKQPFETTFTDTVDISSDDFIESSTFFGGVTKNIISKNFKGARITTYFGGTELNLTQADFQEPVAIDLSCAFGGVTVIVPSNWQVKSEVTTIFGGLDDKRPILKDEGLDTTKVLTLKGSCYFGGVEIRSYV